MENLSIILSVISTLTTVCIFILIVSMKIKEDKLSNNETLSNIFSLNKQIVEEINAIKSDERIDLINIEAKALAMKINSLEAAFFMNGSSKLDINAPEWLISDGKVKKYFSPGKIERVENTEDHSLITFEYIDNNKVLSKTYFNDILKYEIIHSEYGNPVSGQAFDDNENCVAKYSYDKLGQVRKDN